MKKAYMRSNRTGRFKDDTTCAEEEVAVVGYQPPVIKKCFFDNNETMQRISINDPAIAGLNVFLSIYDFEDDMSIEEEDDGSGVHKGNIANAIRRSNQLRKLIVSDPAVYMSRDYIDLSPFFQRMAKNRSIEQLSLDSLDFSTLDVFPILAPFFKNNRNLRCVKVSGFDVSKRIPTIIPAMLQQKNIRLEQIDFSYSDLGDARAADFINAISSMPSVRYLLDLFLTNNKIGREGCSALSNLLKNPKCNIQRMKLLKNDLDDTCMEALANGMVKNKSIKVFDLRDFKFVTPNGWRTFVSYYVTKHFATAASKVESAFADTDRIVMTMMPDAIGWMKRDCLGFSAVYDTVRSMPWLLDFTLQPVASDAVPTELFAKIRKVDI